jgi:glycerol-3-phosphate dehydrogenase (NAD(P)+)
MSERYEIGVLGAGGWGTALAVLLAREGRRVALWGRDPRRVAALRTGRENPRLAGVRLLETLDVTGSFPAADILLLAVPIQYARGVLQALPVQAQGTAPAEGTPLVLCCKGLEAGSMLLPPELARALHPQMQVALLTGPNFAHEVAAGLPAASVLAAEDAALRTRLMRQLRSASLRLYGSPDIIGAALGGAAKNVIAIAAGAVMGAGMGENARAALITRGIAEIARLATALGGRAETVSGLSGLGDLLLTCTGASSRNFSLGFELGRNIPLAEILASRSGVTEGIATAPALAARARQAGVEMPITEVVTALLANEMNVQQSMAALMRRAERDE